MLDGELKSLDAGSDAGLSASYVLMLLERYIFSVLFDSGIEVCLDCSFVFAVDEDRLCLYFEEFVK